MSEHDLVQHSILGQAWHLRECSEALVQELAQHTHLPEIARRVLAARNITSAEVKDFLQPMLKKQLPDPFHLLDMAKAATRLAEAIEQNQTIAVFGDYDVDGATSSAVLARFFEMLGQHCLIYIPNRMEEGYGPNLPALQKLHQQGARVVITVDCGTLSFDPLEQATALGLDIIVVDHHTAEVRLPKIFAVINPNRLDQDSSCGTLAAVGVCFLLIVALNKTLRERGYYNSTRPEPNILQLLDLVALGTVCDVMPLTGLNRAFVAQGLKILSHRTNLGLRTLCDHISIEPPLSAYHLGFSIGPRINAGGRIGNSDLGVRLLTTHNESEAQAVCDEMEKLNLQRKDIEQVALAQAHEQALLQLDQSCLVLASQHWHQGVIGIIAGRLKETFHRPVCVISIEGGYAKGSGRSVPGVDLGEIIRRAAQEKLILQGGGHAMAAGFALDESGIPELSKFLDTMCSRTSERMFRPKLEIDACLGLEGASAQVADFLEELGPFGSGHPSPKFMIKHVRAMHCQPVGRKLQDPEHVRCELAPAIETKKLRLPAIAFRACGTPLEHVLMSDHKPLLDVCGTLRLQFRNGMKKVQFWIEDIALASS